MTTPRSRLVIAALSTALLAAGCATAPPAKPPPTGSPRVVSASPEEPRPARPFPEASFADLLVAEFALRRGHYEQALAHYAEQAAATRDVGVTVRATRLAQFLGDDATTLETARLWAELDPASLEASQLTAALLTRRQRPLEALPYMIAVQQGGGSGNFAALAAAALEQPEAVRQGIESALDQQLEQFPEEAELVAAKALMLQHQGRLDEALQRVREVLRREPGNIHSAIIEARLLQQLDRGDEARQRLEQLVEEYPDSRRLRLQYARLLMATDLEAAREQFEHLVQQSPHDPDLRLSLALLSQEAGRSDEARRHLQMLLQLGQRTSEAHFYLGQLAEQSQQVRKALAHYRAVGPGQEFFAAIGRSTGLLLRHGGLDSARSYLSETRASHPEQAVRLYQFESELLQQHHLADQALELLNEALEHHPNQAGLLYARSLLSEQRGDVEAVERDLRSILDREPNHSAALNALGYTLANLTDRHREARQLIRRALELEPDEPAILDSMGWVEYRLGNLERARDYLEQAHERLKDEEVAAHLGEVLWQLGEQDRAREVWREALRRDPNGPTLLETIQRLTGEAP